MTALFCLAYCIFWCISIHFFDHLAPFSHSVRRCEVKVKGALFSHSREWPGPDEQ